MRLAAAVVCVVLSSLSGAADAAAAWSRSSTAPVGTVTTAVLGAELAPAAGVSADRTSYSGDVLVLAPPIALELRNTSSLDLPVLLSLSKPALLTLSATVETCAVPWTAGTCASGRTTLAVDVLSSQLRTATTPVVPAGRSLYLRLSFTVSVLTRIDLRVAPVRPAGRDRTSS
ncbi:hypothetical protein [Kineococcus sp. SYSU DK004]|uniref:hypothetical protein n=1 Tax=Kineococcus sp. SYSU DK004 TaxID=3383125 RepID=UPI003D7D0B0A